MKISIVALALVASFAHAKSSTGYHYDYKTGNSYTKFGNTTLGTNGSTGSTWSSTTTGSQTYGTDSKGNSWNYNSTTGNYWNSNGTSCFGKGTNRICNK